MLYLTIFLHETDSNKFSGLISNLNEIPFIPKYTIKSTVRLTLLIRMTW